MAFNNYEEFRSIITDMVSQIVETTLKDSNIFVSHYGEVSTISHEETYEGSSQINPYSQKCKVDLSYTEIEDVLNKSGQVLKVKDSVTILEKQGSHFANCFIFIKNGQGV